MWKTCFSTSQNEKNESQLKQKNQVRNRVLINSQDFEYEGLFLSLRDEHIKTNVYINFNKINVNLNFLFTRNQVFKHKGVVSNLHVCCNGVGKMWASYIFHFFTKNSNLHTYEKFNIFLHNVCRDDQHSLFRSR